MRGLRNLWITISIAVFLAFSYIAGGVSLLLFAALFAGFLLFLASNSKLARAFMFCCTDALVREKKRFHEVAHLWVPVQAVTIGL